MDLAMIQIYPRLEAGTSPGVPNLEDLNNMLMQLRDYAVASNHQLKGEISELGREIIARMKVEKVDISSRNQTIHLSQDEILSLPTNLDSIREAIRITEEAVMENQKRLLKHVAELKKMQTLEKQVSERIENLEELSWQSQKMFQAVTERQDKSDGQLNAVKQIVLDLSEPKLPMVQTTVQHQSMEVDASASGIGAYDTDTANLMEFVTKKCNEVQEIQHRSLTAAIESLKQWALSAHKKEIKPKLEQAMGNSSEIQKQRLELDSLKDVKQQLDRISQDQRKLSDKLVTMESIELQTVKENTQNQLNERCHQNKDPIQNELPTTNPHAQRSPILIENDGFLIVEEGGI
ncbi:hypothetical protein MJO28_006639 [Puccinia striiformis f. sp. tritici]|uniref:Uncharacterized protein n=1 Tax=Puccinia striiformis f. sp. tritici TaxID=168172 RepID=A0ACC0EHE9_9BASI|nr:hypothetical protein MJO28_006639 [Puccinia striiformis f. sp. tritici]KAI7958387.1 hypothetical protein MJO29_006604 [Puccinia striiformis f. sp. tritici]